MQRRKAEKNEPRQTIRPENRKKDQASMLDVTCGRDQLMSSFVKIEVKMSQIKNI